MRGECEKRGPLLLRYRQALQRVPAPAFLVCAATTHVLCANSTI